MEKYLKYVSIIICIVIVTIVAIDWQAERVQQEKISNELKAKANEQSKNELAERKRLEELKESIPVVYCWGDSLTAGAGSNDNSYPSVLQALSKLKVHNYGVGGEKSYEIAARQGGYKLFVEPFTLSSKSESQKVNLVGEDSRDVNILLQGDAGVNPCSIGDVDGVLTYNKDEKQYNFRRLLPGDSIEFTDRMAITTAAEKEVEINHILVIYSGQNDGVTGDSIERVIETQQKMIEFNGSNKYIVIGLTGNAGMKDELDSINKRLAEEYGEHFIDFRDYMINDAMNDFDIDETEQDAADINNGLVPISFRSDGTHGNELYYQALGEQVYNKILELKYLTEEQVEYLNSK